MKPIKISQKDAELLDLGTKKILKYPLPTRLMSVAHMTISGRNPEKGFFIESDCAFCLYVTNGKGRVYVEKEIFDVEVGDVVLVPTEYKFAMEGKFEYVTFDAPAFYPEQSGEVSI